ncbi:MAG: tetratricopeptide repeat protein [Proteobacteria bacterium]|nr:tetratricopeptide repeat protein [Pseudomonadota bacterium]
MVYIFIIVSVILGAIGGFVSPNTPILGASFIFIGIIGTVLALIIQRNEQRNAKFLFDIQSKLLANNGVGNVYLEQIKIERETKGRVDNILQKLENALRIDPGNTIALQALAMKLVGKMYFWRWAGDLPKEKLNRYVNKSKKLLIKLYRKEKKSDLFCCVLGLIYDIEGKHSDARRWFVKAGKMRKDPYWRLLVSTSWGMEGHYENAKKEMEKAVASGAKGWLVDFYYGRALCFTGDSIRGISYLDKAYKVYAWQPELLECLADANREIGRYFIAGKYFLRCFYILLINLKKRGAKIFVRFLWFKCFGLFFLLSNKLKKITKYIPFIAEYHEHLAPCGEPFYTLGLMAMEKGKWPNAVALGRQALLTKKDNPDAMNLLGSALAKMGERDEAIAILSDANKKYPYAYWIKHNLEGIKSGHIGEAGRVIEVEPLQGLKWVDGAHKE